MVRLFFVPLVQTDGNKPQGHGVQGHRGNSCTVHKIVGQAYEAICLAAHMLNDVGRKKKAYQQV